MSPYWSTASVATDLKACGGCAPPGQPGSAIGSAFDVVQSPVSERVASKRWVSSAWAVGARVRKANRAQAMKRGDLHDMRAKCSGRCRPAPTAERQRESTMELRRQ